MAQLDEPAVRDMLDAPNHAVISTLNADGTILSNVVWLELADGTVSVNSSRGRRWPTNLERDPRCTLLVYPQDNPYTFVEIRGTAQGTSEDADAQIDRLAKKYMGRDEYPFRSPEEERVKFVITPDVVRHRAAG